MAIDLHVHTDASDGLFPPEAVYKMAGEAGLKMIAITDHDTVRGYDRADAGRDQGGPTLVPGVEFTTTFETREVHVLGYFREKIPAPIRDFLTRTQGERRKRIRAGVERLNDLGVPLAFSEVESLCTGDCIGRSHLARALVERGTVRTVRQAFERYLAAEHEIIPNTETSVEEVLARVRESGGVSVWAHPDIDLFDCHVKEFQEAGLDGVEVYSPRSSGVKNLYVERVAEDLGLLKAGGSDWHGHPTQGPLGRFRVAGGQIGALLSRLGVA
ncbi:MAG: PHP domain-containing protein [Planctomycetes bacterium]|nr:PHP domain-containing protein [Planctomycetota bacterium]